MKHTSGAIRAAEIITGGTYGDKDRYSTEYGKKTVEGIADLIDRETAAPDLLRACKELVAEFEEKNRVVCEQPGVIGYPDTGGITLARQAIAKAEER